MFGASLLKLVKFGLNFTGTEAMILLIGMVTAFVSSIIVIQFQEKPALVVELKWNESANGAIEQIKKKEYCKSLEEYKGNILLVGVNYNKKTKKHECIIEEDIK